MKRVGLLLVIVLVCSMVGIVEAKRPAIDNIVDISPQCAGIEVTLISDPQSPVCVCTTVHFSIKLPCGWEFESAHWEFDVGKKDIVEKDGATPFITYKIPGKDYAVTMNGTAKDKCGQIRCIRGDMTITIFEVDLYLDIDNNFDPTNPINDIDNYLPAGTSNNPQTIKVIALATANGQPVQPGKDYSVTFSLRSAVTSSYKGYCINAGTSTDADFALGTPTTVNFGADGTARIDIYSKDYGGTTVVDMHASWSIADPYKYMKIPKDTDGDDIADKWEIDEVGDLITLKKTGDIEPRLPKGLGASKGDGFYNLEEYRGRVVGGAHARTHPAQGSDKDFYIDGTDIDPHSDPSGQPLGIGGNLINLMGINVVSIDQDNGEMDSKKRVNYNHEKDQKGVLIEYNNATNRGPLGQVYVWPHASPNTSGNVQIFCERIWAASYYIQARYDATVDVVVAHEVGHTVNMDHKDAGGDPDHIMYFEVNPFDLSTHYSNRSLKKINLR